MPIFPKKRAKVTIFVALTPKQVKALEKLRQLSGCKTLEETIQKALKVYANQQNNT